MRLLSLICIVIVCALASSLAQADPVMPTPAIAGPMVMAAPLQGVVTIVVPRGQFYTNLGAVDQLPCGAGIFVLRHNTVIGQARIIDVDRLDSIAELLPGSQEVVLEAGDKVVVQFANAEIGTSAAVVTQPFPLVSVGNRVPTICPVECPKSHRRLPDIEPDMGLGDVETFFTVAALVSAGLIIANP